MNSTQQIVPSVSRSDQRTFETNDTFFAAVLLADNSLQLVSWDLEEDGQPLWTFADPEGEGRALEIAHQNSRERRIWASRAYLMAKAKGMGAFVDRSGNRARR